MFPTNMSLQQYEDYLITKSDDGTDVYDEGKISDAIIEKVKCLSCHGLHGYWAENSQTILTNAAY